MELHGNKENTMVSIRHEQGQPLTGVEADKTNSVAVKTAVVVKLKIQNAFFGVDTQVTNTGTNAVHLKHLSATGFVFILVFCFSKTSC